MACLIFQGIRFMSCDERCQVCGGSGYIDRYNTKCPCCRGRGVVYDPGEAEETDEPLELD